MPHRSYKDENNQQKYFRRDIDKFVIHLGSIDKYKPLLKVQIKRYYFHENVLFDIGIIELLPDINPEIKMGTNMYLINGICLPERRIVNKQHEEAIISGFGYFDANASKESSVLRKATYLMDPYPDNECQLPDFICVTEAKHMSCYVSLFIVNIIEKTIFLGRFWFSCRAI